MVERSPDRLGGDPAIRGTPVRPMDLLVSRAEGDAGLARVYDVPEETVRSVLRYHDRHKRHRAPAV
jgi:uncharacterized protein (DUF433 family)